MKMRLANWPSATGVTAGIMLAMILSGCSPKVRTERLLAEADHSFAAGQYDQAEIDYLNVLQAQPQNAEAIGRLASIYFDEGLLGRVYPYLAKGCELQPNNLDLRLKLGLVFLQAGRLKEARDEAGFVLDHRPADAEAPLLLAEAVGNAADILATRERLQRLPQNVANGAPVLVALGTLKIREHDFKAAEALFLQAEKVDPQSASAKSALGALYWAQGDLLRAERDLAAAADLSPPRSAKRLQYAQFEVQTGHPDAARRLLEDITKKSPDFVPAWLLLAQIAANERKFAESAGFNARVLARDGNNPEALLLGSRLLVESGDLTKAETELARILKLYPRLPQAHYQLGMVYLAEGEMGQAAASTIKALTLAPDYPDAAVLLATINVRRGDPSAAIVSLKQVVSAHPAIRNAWLTLAGAYRSIGDFDNAIGVCRQLEKEFPDDPQITWLIGLLYLQQNRPDDARQIFAATLEKSPDYLPALEQLVNLDVAAREYQRAAQNIAGRLAKNPAQPGLYLLQAKVALAQGEAKSAETSLQQAIKLQPDSPTAYFMLAQMYVASNQHARALANLQEVVANNPKNVEALMLMAVIHDQQKDYLVARDTYEKLLAINPRFSAALNNLAYLYSEQFHELEKAYQMALRARELLPHEPHTADTLGWILFQKRQYTWALSLVDESAENLPDSAEIQFHLGATHYMLGEEKPARLALERAVKNGGESSWMALAKQDLAVLAIDALNPGPEARAKLDDALAKQKDDPVALVRLAAICQHDGQPDKAVAAYQAAREASPKDVAALVGLASFDEAHGDARKAFELAKTARQMAPDDAAVAHLLGRLAYKNGNFPWALTLLQESAHGRSDDPALSYDLALACFSEGNVEEAKAAAQRALQADPNYARSDEVRRLLESLALAGSPAAAANAVPSLEQALKSDPSNGPALVALAAGREQKGETAAAIALYEKVLDHFPDFSPAKKQLAIMYAGEPVVRSNAFDLAVKARDAYPFDAEVAKALGLINYRRGDFAAAINLLKESAKARPDDGESIFYLGMALRQNGQQTEGNQALQRAVELKLKPDLAAQARRALADAK